MSSYTMVKAGCCVPIASTLDTYVNRNPNLQDNITFGMCSAGSLFVGDFVANMIPTDVSGGNSYYSNKTVLQRVIEITVGSGTAYTVNRYVMKNDYAPSEMAKKLGVLMASDVLSAYCADYINGTPLTFLTGNV